MVKRNGELLIKLGWTFLISREADNKEKTMTNESTREGTRGGPGGGGGTHGGSPMPPMGFVGALFGSMV